MRVGWMIRVAGFARIGSSPSKTRLSASFVDRLFSTTSSTPPSMSSNYFTVGITGAGGLVGTALRDELAKRETLNGKPVRIVRLSRGDKADSRKTLEDVTETSLTWNPKGSSPQDVIGPAIEEMDAIVHLAGENVATGLGPLGFLGLRPWTDAKKAEILDSRVGPTQALSSAIAASASSKVFLVASGIGAYGGDFIGDAKEAVDESMDISSTSGFLAEISRQWEGATKAVTKKNRLVLMRFGVVLSKKGGALAKLYPIFFLGGGGLVGSGNQYFTFISARDHARAIVHTLETKSLEGPVNYCAQQPCTNAEFTSAFGKVLGRPTIFPLPAFVVSLVFGEMGDEMLLGGTRALPSKLVKSGFKFEHDTIEQALQSAVDESI
jgi:uncharacterized protein (TIGR01777 family)